MSLERVLEERQILAEAIFKAAVDLKIARPDASPNGPELLMMLEEIVEAYK